MSLPKQLAQKKAAVLKSWVEVVINSYPPETARFLNNQSDPFANPVGETTQRSLTTLFDLLIDEHPSRDQARDALDPVIRIRAIQDFTPAQAVRFMFDLKRVIRDVLHLKRPQGGADPRARDELSGLDERIDELGLLAFDIYMQCREKIYELKANEMKDRTFKAFARAGLVKEPVENL
jgi:hypothetical protein